MAKALFNKGRDADRKLFVGGLDYGTTSETLRLFYEKWGAVVDAFVVEQPYNSRNRGYGFVTYASPNMVDEAMKNRPHIIDGKTVTCRRSITKGESYQRKKCLEVASIEIFVGDLKEQTEDEMREYFGTFGRIVCFENAHSEERGRHVFIKYNDYDPVDKILLIKDHTVGGKRVTVKKVHQRSMLSHMVLIDGLIRIERSLVE